MDRICAGYIGEMGIPEDKREEFSDRVFQVLHQGGMMQIEAARLRGQEVPLLKPLQYDEEGRLIFCYNYFGDSFREEAGYDRNTCTFQSGDVGFGEFQRVICAVYVLFEFYTDTFGLAELNGRLFDAGFHIGWLNYLFREQYTDRRAIDPWGIADLFHKNDKELDKNLEAFLDEGEVSYSSLARYCYVEKGSKTFLELWNKKNKGFCGLVRKLEEDLEKAVGDQGRDLKETEAAHRKDSWEDVADFLLHSLELDFEERMKLLNEEPYQALAVPFLVLPPEFLVKAVAQAGGKDFWPLWEQWRPRVKWVRLLEDEQSLYCSPYLPVRTADFLRLPPYQIIKVGGKVLGEDYFRTTDDDRVFYWREDGDVVFSEEMKNQFLEWKKEYERIRNDRCPSHSGDMWIQKLVNLLTRAERSRQRIYAFQEMFYEFLGNSGREEYQAAILLLECLLNRSCKKGIGFGKKNIDWESLSRKVTFYPDRILLKRYLALLANKALRNKVLGF